MNTIAAINVIARYEARDAIKAALRAEGHRLSEYAAHDITVLAQAYLSEHPEVFNQAAEIVRNHLKLRTLAAREARKRKANQA